VPGGVLNNILIHISFKTCFVASYSDLYKALSIYGWSFLHNQTSPDIAFGELNAAEIHTIDLVFPSGHIKSIDMLWFSGKLDFLY
jgi:hypothetical protein